MWSVKCQNYWRKLIKYARNYSSGQPWVNKGLDRTDNTFYLLSFSLMINNRDLCSKKKTIVRYFFPSISWLDSAHYRLLIYFVLISWFDLLVTGVLVVQRRAGRLHTVVPTKSYSCCKSRKYLLLFSVWASICWTIVSLLWGFKKTIKHSGGQTQI